MFPSENIMLALFCVVIFVYLPLTAHSAEPLPFVKVFSTGGTIASKYDAAKGGLNPDELQKIFDH
jgi:L-asparaginase/Glu-tRNA(Gln) amidotransferase subunit D